MVAAGAAATHLSILREKAAKLVSAAAMIGAAGQNRQSTVKLFQDHDPHQLVGPGRPTEGEMKVGILTQGCSDPVRSADHEHAGRTALVAPALQRLRKRRRAEIFATFVQQDGGGSVRNEL